MRRGGTVTTSDGAVRVSDGEINANGERECRLELQAPSEGYDGPYTSMTPREVAELIAVLAPYAE